jgi:hypothetical protein
MSSRQKQRAEKLKERAVDLGGKLEKKVAAKEGRKVSFRHGRDCVVVRGFEIVGEPFDEICGARERAAAMRRCVTEQYVRCCGKVPQC